MRRICFLLSAFVLAAAAAQAGQLHNCAAPKDHVERVALVIGNGHYGSDPQISNLKSPPNDATQIGQKLCQIGFTYVDVEINQNNSQINGELANLNAEISDNTGLAFVYYSGHGEQTAGTPYLLPVRHDGGQGTDTPISINAVFGSFGASHDKLGRVVVFDACRNDGGAVVTTISMNVSGQSTMLVNYFAAWAASSGAEASGTPVGVHSMSPYAYQFVKAVGTYDLEIDHLHKVIGRCAHVWMQRYVPAYDVLPEQTESADFGDLYYDGMLTHAPSPVAAECGGDEGPDGKVAQKSIVKLPQTMSVDDLLANGQKALSELETAADREVATGKDAIAPDVYFAQAAADWNSAWGRGSDTAGRRLADLYYKGRGVPKNTAAACAIYQKIGEKDPYAVQRLGTCYRDGWNCAMPACYDSAMRSYSRALTLGLKEANADIAYMTLLGYGTAKDPARALSLFKTAEADGVAEASAWIAWMEWTGNGTTADINAAHDELQKSIASGDVAGMQLMSKLLDGDYGIARDKAQSDLTFDRSLKLADVWFIKEYHLGLD